VRFTKATPPTSSSESSEAALFSELFDRYAQAVYTFCARRTADLALAEDLTSITFLEAWRHRGRVQLGDVGSALPWLLGVANNVARNARRGQRRYSAVLERLPTPSVAPPAEDQVVARAETEAGLQIALDAVTALPQGEQEAVMLVLWSGLSYEDAATAMAIPVGTVRSRISRARTKLQTSLGNPVLSLTKESS
jgi:RNA polymerase sigma factor (sigma-70 family)